VNVDIFGFQGSPYFQLDLPLSGWVVLGAYALATLAWLAYTRRDFARLTASRHAYLLLATLIAAPLLAQTAVIRLDAPVLAAGPGQPHPPAGLGLAPLGALPLVVAAAWLGPGPAILVGLASGFARAGWDTFRAVQPFEIALWAGAMGVFLRQPYRGLIGNWLRQPLAAATLAGMVLAWPLTLVAVGTTGPVLSLASLEAALALAQPTLVAYAGEAFFAGVLVQVVLLVLPAWHPVDTTELLPPRWARHLNRRILFTLTPLVALTIVLLVGGVALAAYRMSTTLVVDQMAHNAATVDKGVPFFVQVGRSLLHDLAEDERLLNDDDGVRQKRLDEGLRAVPFFQELVYFDRQGDPANTYPPEISQQRVSDEEQALVTLALEGGIPAEATIFAGEVGTGPPVSMSFVAPVYDRTNGEVAGALLGRAALTASPLMQPVVDMLGGVLADSGEGFILDETNRILLYPAHPERQLETFELATAALVETDPAGGRVFRQTHDDGTQQLVYLQPIAGHSGWSVVVTVPNQVVLALAVKIALPVLVILVAMATLSLPFIIAIATRLAEPLEALARAADRIAAGQLDQPVRVSGEDEVGRLGLAFEGMRRGLKARLDEQETLLEVSYAVSASLELFRALPPILHAALDATGALGVRIVLVREDGSPQVFAAGEGAAGMAPMDEELLEHADQQGALVVSRMERARATLTSSDLVPRIQSLVALPIHSEAVFLGILWLAHEEERPFEQTELTFLSQLVSQASFAVANARLFEAAEGGRRQLAAILSSTPDAVVVVDKARRLLLINPAAEETFAIEAAEARGKTFEEVITQPKLVELLSDLEGETVSVELEQEEGRTLLANASPIVGADGAPLGRVVLLSDITYLKELDELKTAFVNTVSHDLRAPLTFMSGYVTMLPMVGDLNDKQQEFATKIKIGIEQMSDLIEKLLNLGRIEAGAPLDLEACDVQDLLVTCCETMAEPARAKRLNFKLDLPDHLPYIPADTTLYRQAVTNLLENAIKYTPERGSVKLSASVSDDAITIAIRDTGQGIGPEDLEQLFEPFFRVRSRRTASIKGSGLGLAIVKGVAERHGGRVWVESELDKGSTFYLEMPRRQPEE